MPPDTVQIGHWVVSESLLYALIPVLSVLLGTLMGVLLTFFTSSALEERKWRRENKSRLRAEQREALALILP